MKKNKTLFWTCFGALTTLLYSSLALAANNANVMEIFSPKPIVEGTDKSIILLGQIFGSVDGVLHGVGSQILGTMFGVYNASVIGLGGIIILYTLIVSTLNTAHEGEYLGKKWNSMWIPIRSAMGVALMIPKASGYSVIQIFVMWVVVQGVGAADTLWNTTLKYIVGNGTMMPSSMNNSELKKIGVAAVNMFKSQICLQKFNKLYNNEHPDEIQVHFSPSYPVLNAAKTSYSTYFPDRQSTPDPSQYGTQDFCGSFTFGKPVLTDGDYKQKGDLSDAQKERENATLQQAVEEATWQMSLDMGGYAGQIIENKDSTNDTTAKIAVANAILDYVAILDPALKRNQRNVTKSNEEKLLKFGNDGWITAGATYQFLSGLQANRAVSTSYLPSFIAAKVDKTNIPSISDTARTDITVAMGTLKDATAKQAADYLVGSDGKGGITKGDGMNPDKISTKGGRIALGLMNAVTLGLLDVASDWEDAFNHSNVDPLQAITFLGNRIVSRVSALWFSLAILIFGIAFATGCVGRVVPGIATAFQVLIQWIIPFMTFIMILLFSAGVTMAYYVPLVPYIIFLFGAMGWMIGVIESIVAAPLVALGITHPEGHEVYGRADPAVMLLVNIFLRPSLMIIGFIAGILLSSVGLRLLNLSVGGFADAFSNLRGHSALGMGIMYQTIGMLVIYTALVIMIINRAFSLITEVPNKVLRWIGSAEQLGESSADLGQVQGAVGGVGKLGQLSGELGSFAKGSKDLGDHYADKPKKGEAKLSG